MGQDSKIEWTHHTFNAWRGCTKVSDGCKHCYADTLSKRNPKALGIWGPRGQRVIAAEAYWRQPIAWDKAAAETGERHRVFCLSLGDVFEGEDTMPDEAGPAILRARLRLFDLIDETPNLDWLLLTKRPENIRRMTPIRAVVGGSEVRYRENVWLMTSVENQETADERIPHLLSCRDLAPVLGLSCEPLLGAIDLHGVNNRDSALIGSHSCIHEGRWSGDRGPKVDWVIAGGESGPGARPMHTDWARSLRDQCSAAGVAFFFKQCGEYMDCCCVGDAAGCFIGDTWQTEIPWNPAGNYFTGVRSLMDDKSPQQCRLMARVGKKAAGRLLDGREWNEFPVPAGKPGRLALPQVGLDFSAVQAAGREFSKTLKSMGEAIEGLVP